MIKLSMNSIREPSLNIIKTVYNKSTANVILNAEK